LQRLVPESNRKLARDDGGAALDAILDHFQEITSLLGCEWLESKVIDDQDADPRPGSHQTGKPAVAASSEQLGEHPRCSLIESCRAMTDGSLSQSTGEVGLAGPSWAGDQGRLVGVNPMTCSQVKHLRAVQSTRVSEVDVFNTGAGAKLRFAEIASKALVLTVLSLTIDEKAEAVLEAKRVVLGTLALF
jgi:hypothetical protein